MASENPHSALCAALMDLRNHPCPSTPSPPNVPKRAALTLVFRVQPNPAFLPEENVQEATSIKEFFEQPWVQHGEPEVLFIKRTKREGDRWSSHVAFPGGKRDPEDAGDLEAALRETIEEVGLNVGALALPCGKLPDRVVLTSWGTKPLMVLCPFVYLLTSPDPPALHPQPTEVASVHWVPLRILLSPTFRTVEKVDVADRLARRPTGRLGAAIRHGITLAVGQMEFAAIRLWPSKSVYSTFSKDYLVYPETGKWESPLILWGLTLAVVQDLLDIISPNEAALKMWKWPTFTALDVRLVIALMTRGLVQRNFEAVKHRRIEMANIPLDEVAAEILGEEEHKVEKLGAGPDHTLSPKLEDNSLSQEEISVSPSQSSEDLTMDESAVLVPGNNKGSQVLQPPEEPTAQPIVIATMPVQTQERIRSVDILLEGYYKTVSKAVWITIAGRAALVAALVGTVVYRASRR